MRCGETAKGKTEGFPSARFLPSISSRIAAVGIEYPAVSDVNEGCRRIVEAHQLSLSHWRRRVAQAVFAGAVARF